MGGEAESLPDELPQKIDLALRHRPRVRMQPCGIGKEGNLTLEALNQ